MPSLLVRSFPAVFHLLEGSQDPIQLFLRVGRHVTGPEEFSSWRDGRANDRIDKDPIFEEELAHLVVFKVSLIRTGMTGVSLIPVSYPSVLNPLSILWVFLQS